MTTSESQSPMPVLDVTAPAEDPTGDKQPRKGLIVGRNYRLLEKIGQGGMGVVWQAERIDWHTSVAVKLLHERLSRSKRDLSRFEREIRLLATLPNAHVVSLLDSGHDSHLDRPYLVMELLQGQTLDERLQQMPRLSVPAAFAILEQVAQGLAMAHGHNFIHRDLKPPNIFLCEVPGFAPKVKLLDFGIAKALNGASSVTAPGTNPGTPWYMSPERWTLSSNPSPADDLWSFAVIAFECLTGVRPYQTENLADMLPLLHTHRPKPSDHTGTKLPPAIDQWFLQATSPKVEDRFASVAESCQALAQACGIATNAFAVQEGPSRTVETLEVNIPNTWTARNAFASTVLEQEGGNASRRRKLGIVAAATVVSAVAGTVLVSQVMASKPQAEQVAPVTGVQALKPAEQAPAPLGEKTPATESPLSERPSAAQAAQKPTPATAEPPAYRAAALPTVAEPPIPPSTTKAAPQVATGAGNKASKSAATDSAAATDAKSPAGAEAAEATESSTATKKTSKAARRAKSESRSRKNRKAPTEKRSAKASRSKPPAKSAQPTPKKEPDAKRLKDNRIYHTDL